MNSRLLVGVLVLIGMLSPNFAQSQTGPAVGASPDMVATALRQLNCQFSIDDYKYKIEINDRAFTLYRLDSGNRLLLKASIKGQTSLATINRYNEKSAVATRAVQHEKMGLLLETGVDCQYGISEAGIKKLVTRFADDIGDFEAFITKNSAPDPIAKREKQKVPMQIKPDTDDKELLITFPTGDAKWETAWKIVWDMETAAQAAEQGYKFNKNPRNILFKIKKA